MRIPITPIREEISINTIFFNDEKILKYPGITRLETRNPVLDKLRGFNCVKYCFGKDIPHWIPYKNHVFGLPIEGYSEVRNPEMGDIAIYISGSNRFDFEFQHVGIITTAGRVRSKWGPGNIYLHSPELVPDSYGETLKFFRKK